MPQNDCLVSSLDHPSKLLHQEFAAFAPLVHLDAAGRTAAKRQAILFAGSEVSVGKFLLPAFLFIGEGLAQPFAVNHDDRIHVECAGVTGDGEDDSGHSSLRC